ncbi:hypothetical protein ZEAMMB73_Zm00001d035468 [Zea mays]|uniref:Uncharacterized protein n=1 Tax=Zea mays TaxID=4577 RepID=A0A1D6LGH8_MAIZE|nr:hypothetical protein ZEAMMB73_Zm00001d035468 [Zea mays]AQK79019.1 hypothetical protein ZEAMMB73_Zm00001d035468 [Zea mays]AQK79020.1 hypothetical protein ZEAMMB73_Zm00001d035468 [Zea mays]AQK79021.1 hypothetical protein ZEAMMB73_Zm00001d035468 [Zea mays]
MFPTARTMTPSRRRRKGSGRRWRLPAPAPGFKPPIRPRIQWNGRYDICQNRENVWKVRRCFVLGVKGLLCLLLNM